MIVNAWLTQAQKQLESAGVGTARLDTLVLLEDVTDIDRARLLAKPGLELSTAQITKLEKLLNRRARHEPLAYIRGRTEFYGREFVLTPVVLEPRPESETMIDLLKGLSLFRQSQPDQTSRPKKSPASSLKTAVGGSNIKVADVGAGSGALGITAKLELPATQVDLLEIDPQAIKVAKINVDKFTLKINITRSNLLASSSNDYTVLLCNLPYVPDGHTINEAAHHEPKIAIFGGPDGLDVYRKLFKQVSKLSQNPLYILTESLPPQHANLQEIAQQHGYQLQQSSDFIQVFAHPKN